MNRFVRDRIFSHPMRRAINNLHAVSVDVWNNLWEQIIDPLQTSIKGEVRNPILDKEIKKRRAK